MMKTLLVRHARLLGTMDATRREIEDGALFTRDGVIETVCPTDELPLGLAEAADRWTTSGWPAPATTRSPRCRCATCRA